MSLLSIDGCTIDGQMIKVHYCQIQKQKTKKYRDTFDFDPMWDDPKYDYLGEFYSSHVNPLFWRLHGWVDDRIEDWFNAHESMQPGEIERQN